MGDERVKRNVKISGALLIAYAVYRLIFNLSPSVSLYVLGPGWQIFAFAVLVTTGIGIIRMKQWARSLFLGIVVASILLSTGVLYILFLTLQIFNVFDPTARHFLITLLVFGWVVFSLLRPGVKEAFYKRTQ